MKKGLSLLLAFAMVFSMFASVAFAADNNLTTEQKYQWFVDQGVLKGYPDGDPRLGNNLTRAEFATIAVAIAGLEPKTDTETFSDVKSGQWWHGAIEAAAAAGLVNGVGGGKFDPRSNVTLEQVIAVAVRILGLDPVEDANVPGASAWAAGYVQAALDAGLITPQSDYKVAATRGQTIDIVYPTYQRLQLNVESATVLDAKTVEVKFTDGSVVKVTLDQPLPANQEQEITVKHESGKEFKVKVTYVVTTATKVESVSATNLKEVVVKFDGEVDKASAEDAEKYSIPGIGLKSAVLSADKTTVTLTLADVYTLKNQEKYKLTVTNVKAGDRTVSAKDVEFIPLDNTLPEVVSVTALGNKAIKVVMSEPVKSTVFASNFKLDGAAYYSTAKVNDREIVLKPYSTLATGNHTLEVAYIEDFNGLKSLPSKHDFTVVEDKEGPKVESVEATFEKVVLTFNEDLDPDTVVASDLYWLSGTEKKYADTVTRLAGNKYEFEFGAGKTLPGHQLTLYLDSVSDYSGNSNPVKEVQVQAQVDQSRPEVVEVKLASDAQSITVRFSKTVTGGEKKYYSLTDKDGKAIGISAVTPSGETAAAKTFTIQLYGKLPEGNNTLKISGIQDTTVLKNTMLDYSTTISVGDTTGPQFLAQSANNAQRLVALSFNEAVDPATATNHANYLIRFNGVLRQLPNDVQFSITQDGKVVQLYFPTSIDNVAVTIPVGPAGTGSLTHIRVSGIKDLAGNVLANAANVPIYTTEEIAIFENAAAFVANQSELTDRKTIKLKFDQPIGQASISDFNVTVGGSLRALDSVVVNGTTEVILKTRDNLPTDPDDPATLVAVTAVPGNNIKTVIGNSVTPGSAGTLVDKVGPEVDTIVADEVNGKIVITFTEELNGGIAGHLYGNDLEIKKVKNTVTPLTNGIDYTVAVNSSDAKQLVVTITSLDNEAAYTVRVKDKADLLYIQDAATTPNKGNGSAVKEIAGYLLDITPPAAAGTDPIVAANGGTVGVIDAGDKITIKFSEKVSVTDVTIGNITVSGGHSLGADATVAAVGAVGGYADTFVITLLGSGISLTAGDTLTITVHDRHGNSGNVTFTVPPATDF